MRNSTDPSTHQASERQFISHVEKLLADPRLMVDTTLGRKSVPNLMPQVTRTDRGTDMKRLMIDLQKPDSELQNRMPVGESMEIILRAKKMMVMMQTVGRIRVVCVSPTRQLLAGETPKPLDLAATRKVLSEIPPAQGIPLTVVLVSTSGFELNAREAASRTADRTVILAEPNEAGGWNPYGPVETKALVDLFDAEAEEQKRKRVRDLIEGSSVELSQGGIAADKLAVKAQLPLQFIEAEVKNFAKSNSGLTAKRLDGRLVLFREGSTPAIRSAPGGSAMPLIDRIKTLFARKGETEKKIAYLAERRTALTQQRDRSFEELTALEQQNDLLTRQFKESASAITRRRVTAQLVQLRKEIERRQQMQSVLNQQINVVGTHLHNLELSQQGKAANLPDSDEIATDAAAAEEMLAQLQADNELADSVGSVAHAGLSPEEQALYEELENESGGPTNTRVELPRADDLDEAPMPLKSKPQKSVRPAEPEAG
jgi:hypothetical protein